MQQKENIWLVDDDPAVAELITRAFAKEQLTCQLATFDSHRLLVKRIESGGLLPALLVVDYYLDGESGLDIVEQLQEDPHTSAIKVVLFSQSLTPAIVQRAQELGVYQVISKPNSFEQWRELARDLCLAGYFL